MPRYFIDTSDQGLFYSDDEGREYPDLDAAKAAAVSALPDMARDALPDGDTRTFLALVRDQEGDSLIQPTLSLRVTRIGSERER